MTELEIDLSKHFLPVWENIFGAIRIKSEQTAQKVKIEFLTKIKSFFGEPLTNIACTEINYRKFLIVLNPILNKYTIY